MMRRWAVVAAAVLLVGLLGAGRVRAQGAVVPAETYWHLVTELRDAAASQGDLATLTGALRGISAVQLDDGRVIPLDNSFLLSRLAKQPPDYRAVEALLSAQLAARDAWATPDPQPNASAALDDVLSRAEFDYDEPEGNWWTDLRDRVTRAFFRLLFGSAENAAFLGRIAPFVAAVVLIGVVAYLGRGLLNNFSSVSQLPLDDVHEEGLSADDALARAQTLSQTGDYRAAVRYLYLSTLLILDDQRVLRYDRTKTNREYLRALAGQPDVATILRDVVAVFDRVWYGFHPLNEPEYRHYEAQVQRLKRMPPQRA